MTTEICSATDIFNINKTKEFTLTATYLLEALLTDSRLLAESSKLWQILYNRARFHENLEVKISYRELATILGKSIRSICRYITDLVQYNYLSIQNNYLVNDGQTVNSIFIRFPKKTVETAIQTKDRAKGDLHSHIADISKQNLILADVLHSVSTDITDNGRDDNDVIANNSIDHEYKITNNSLMAANPIVVDINLNKSTAMKRELKIAPQSIFTGVEAKPLAETQIVSLQEQLASKKRELTVLQQTMQTVQEQLSSEANHVTQFDLMRKFTEYDALVCVEKHAIERLEKALSQHEHHTHYCKELQSKNDYINQQAGNRKLSPFTLKRLQHELQENGYHGEQQTILMNEIVHEIRFGSLVQSNKTQQQLPLEHAANIALKLVREKRWVTPAALGYKVISEDFTHMTANKGR
ncbi:hypothetical protein BH10PSE19_BH10PSE19_01330 [soil metagenome]